MESVMATETTLPRRSHLSIPDEDFFRILDEAAPAADPLPARAEPARTLTRFNRANLRNLVQDGQIFSVEFIKRTTGELRRMVCRLGVKKHLRGGTAAYDAREHNLLTVFDMEKNGYRSIPVEAVLSLTVHGHTFRFAGAI
jgi:hypothetical protein